MLEPRGLLDRSVRDPKGPGIQGVLAELSGSPLPPLSGTEPFLGRVARGVAFVTFAYDIDGVSLEIAKYGAALEEHLAGAGHRPVVHCIGGRFTEKADLVLPPGWKRLVLDNADGWAKWDGGVWFDRLFRSNLPEGSDESRELAEVIWRQAVVLAHRLCDYIEEHEIGLLFAVNVNSNPGNLAFALAIVLSSELTGCPVLNNSHDFYWEGGAPPSTRPAGAQPGPRDHFFRNMDNRPFFTLFERILPWDGRRWIQVNINPLQSHHLVKDQGFAAAGVFTIYTSIEREFFEPGELVDKQEGRRQMTRILARGQDPIEAVAADGFLHGCGEWMTDQKPVVLGAATGLSLDLAAPGAWYFLQPTRVVGRKRIWRDWELIGALLRHPPFREAFDAEPQRTLTLHVTGPVPIEHQADLERIIGAFREVLAGLPEGCARRLFLAFSAGHQTAPGLDEPLAIADIFRNADLILLPSQTEGRGLPILEAAAVGVPIACSRYEPVRVFQEVVGEHLPDDQRISVHEFPESSFGLGLLTTITRNLLNPEGFEATAHKNREAVRRRYSQVRLRQNLAECLTQLEEQCSSEGNAQCTSAS